MVEHKRFSRPFLPWFLLLFSMLMLCTVAGCAATPTPKVRDFAIDNLLIDVSVFPLGWYVGEGPGRFADDRAQEDDRYVEFRSSSAVVPSMHIVFQYRNEQAAAYWYSEYLPAEFHSAFRVSSWQVPPDLPYESPMADQFKFACAKFQNASDSSKYYTRCVAMGQYDEYVSVFFTYISSDSMTYADLERILKAIDERMAHYLGKGSK